MSGRIDKGISDAIFRPVLLEVTETVKAEISGVDFGNLISSYDMVVNIFEGETSEKFWYQSKTKETDIDVTIHHDQYLKGDFNERCVIFLTSILHSIDQLKKNKKLKGFDFDLFHQKVSSLILRYKPTF